MTVTVKTIASVMFVLP